LRAALQQATAARDEAQGELESLRMKATSLEDEHHFLQSEFSAKSADMLEKFSAQVLLSLFLLPLLFFFFLGAIRTNVEIGSRIGCAGERIPRRAESVAH
jgi:hypothetical protein